MDLEIFEQHSPNAKNERDLISRLESYNEAQKPGYESACQHYGFFLRKPGEEQVLGGIVGWTWMGSLHIHRIFLDESIRRNGYGTSLIERAEAHARSLGCSLVTGETLSFQNVLPFYLKHGFKMEFEDSGYSHGVRIYFFRKRLDT